jgi:large subunit ribosomal protein L30
MSFAVVRIRGSVNVSADVKDTLKMLRLNRANHCVIIPENKSNQGMLNKTKDLITWGDVDVDTLARLLHHYALGHGQKLNDDYIKKNTKFKSLRSYAKALCEGTVFLADLKGVNRVLRLHPPVKGYGGVKRPFRDGGALGYRGSEINKLLVRMIFVHKEEPAKIVTKKPRGERTYKPAKGKRTGIKRKKKVRSSGV